MTYATEGDQAIHSIADLVEHDFDGSELPSAETVRETLELWRQNSDAAKQLIDGLTVNTATIRYLLAWTQAYEAEYEPEDDND